MINTFPKDLVSKIELRRALIKMTMKKDDNPATLFEQISALENRYNTENYKVWKGE